MQVLYTKVPDEKRNGTVTVLKIQNHRNVDLRRLLLEHYYGDSPIKSATVTPIQPFIAVTRLGGSIQRSSNVFETISG